MKEIITRAEFIGGKFKTRYDSKEEHPIVTLLKKEPGKAFSVKAICKSIKRTHGSVHVILRALVKKKLVLHKSPYFMWKVNRPSKKR